MPRRLSEHFRESRGAPIEVDGNVVHMMHEVAPIEGRTDLRIQLQASSTRLQAARLKARGGRLRVNDELLEDVVLWSDTAPATVMVTLVPDDDRRPMSLRVWNAWRDAAGAMQAWIGDAGLIVEKEADGVIVLRCSDGYDAADFDDLEIKLEFAHVDDADAMPA